MISKFEPVDVTNRQKGHLYEYVDWPKHCWGKLFTHPDLPRLDVKQYSLLSMQLCLQKCVLNS